MLSQSREIIERHVKTHTERSAEDVAAISTIEFFFRSDGKINTNFVKNDKWPNTDGTFEFVPNPEIDRRPKHSFIVQVKGTHSYTETSEGIKYSLKSLAFPAFIATDVTLDPGLLIIVLNPDIRGQERIFYKYMSVEFINSIDFNKESTAINFTADEEILNTDESINSFCKKLESVKRRGTSDEEYGKLIDVLADIFNRNCEERVNRYKAIIENHYSFWKENPNLEKPIRI